MEQTNQNIDKKVRGIATSSYLMMFISWLFLFNKVNPNINNSFVKSHTKTSMLIHFWFLITYIIFISNWLFSSFSFMWFWLNNIITNIIYIWLLLLLIIWIYKANSWESFNIKQDISISKNKNILDINWDWEISEKEKVTIILSFIPFIWFLIYPKYIENKTIEEATRLNVIITIIITLLYVFSYSNLANLFSLAYIILISFIWINLFSRDELISVKLADIFSPKNTYTKIVNIKDYLISYFKKDNFKEFTEIEKQNKKENLTQEIEDKKILESKSELKLAKPLIYIPFINLIFIFFINTKYYFHIINGLMITLLISIFLVLSILWYINNNLYILFLFPILFWIGYTNKLTYKMPFVFDTYEFIKNIFSFTKKSKNKINEKRKQDNQISLKVN